MIGDASVAVRACQGLGGKEASLRVSIDRLRGARRAWRLPRMMVMCGLSADVGAAGKVACGGGSAASLSGAAALCGAGAGGFSLDLGIARNIRGGGIADGSAADGGAAAMRGGSTIGG